MHEQKLERRARTEIIRTAIYAQLCDNGCMSDQCFHGGAFWQARGCSLEQMRLPNDVVAADVLDAWFPPAPAVLQALADTSAWNLNTSPPTYSEGLVQAICRVRRLHPSEVLPGPGSSALMYLALGQWLRPGSRVLLPEPCYGEYAHLCERLIGCEVERLVTSEREDFRLDLTRWADLARRTDFAVLVNPNNPTGHHFTPEELQVALTAVPSTTRVLIDEAYIDYVGGQSAESLMSRHPNLFVLKSLSKCFALSGIRVAYLAGPPAEIARLRRFSPPWWVSLPAQIAAMAAFTERTYYESIYRKTCLLREELVRGLTQLELRCYGSGNWVLARVPAGESASDLVEKLGHQHIFIRHAGKTAPSLGDSFVRIAVKDGPQQQRIVAALDAALHPLSAIPV